MGKDGKRDGNIFDMDSYDPADSGGQQQVRIKKFKAPHEQGEGTTTRNVGTF